MKTSESRVFRHNSVRSKKKTSNSKNVYKKSTKKQILRFYLQWCNQLLHRHLLPIFRYQNIEQKCQDIYFRLKKKTDNYLQLATLNKGFSILTQIIAGF